MAMTQMTQKEMEAMLAKLQAENEKLRAERAQAGKLSLKVSDKGALSVYGMGRFPVTLYREQWERLMAHKPQIEDFIRVNAKLLSTKEGEKSAAAGTKVDMASGKVVEGDDVPVTA